MPPDPPPSLPPAVAQQVQLLETVVDAVMVCDLTWRCLHVSASLEGMIGRPVSDFLGRNLWDAAPGYVGSPIHALCLEAVARREPADVTWYVQQRGTWVEQRIVPVGDVVLIATRDVSSRENGALRREQLLAVTEALADAVAPEEVAEVTVSLLLTHLPLDGVAVVVTGDSRSPHLLASSGLAPSALRHLLRSTTHLAGDEGGAPGDGRAGHEQMTLLPLRAGTSLLGTLAVSRAAPGDFTDDQMNYLRSASASAAQALSRTLRSAAEHRAAITLQRSLLPEVAGRIGPVALAARYLPGDPGVEVGGDWFDALPAGDGLYLVVGDVQGHDLGAAAIMGQLRSVVRAYAAEGLPPAGILHRADRYLDGLDCDRIVTVLIAYLHRDGEITTIACAGHPPPVVLRRVGEAWTCRDLEVTPGPPLGVPDGRWTESTLLLPADVVLLMFTDGLVETAAWGGIGRGMHELCAALTDLPADATLDDVLDAALDVIPAGLRGDDVAVLAARIPARAGRNARVARRAFPPHAMSVPLARSWLTGLLAGWELSPAADAAEIVLSELVSNAVLHSEEPVAVSLEAGPGELMVEVFDSSHRLPIPRLADAEDPGGRGLAVTAALARQWGVREQLQGKVVWACIDLRGAAAEAPAEPRRQRGDMP